MGLQPRTFQIAIAADNMAIASDSMAIAAESMVIAAETMAIAADNQTWAHNTFKISSSRPSSYFYIPDKNLVLCSLKNKLKLESLVSRKFKQEFYVSIKLKQAKRESSYSSIEQKSPKSFEF